MYQKQINRAFIGLLVCFAVSCAVLAAPPNSSSKEVQKYCQAMAIIAGDSATRTLAGENPQKIKDEYISLLKASGRTEQRGIAMVMSAIDFGVYMAPHYQPAEIARFQYYGCLATV